MLFSSFLGMEGGDIKDAAFFVGGVIVIVMSYLNKQSASEAKVAALEAKIEAQATRTETKTATTDLSNKLEVVEKNVDGKMSQLLEAQGLVKKAEGKAEAIHEAAVIREAVKEAVGIKPSPVVLSASATGEIKDAIREDIKEVSGKVDEVPDKTVNKLKDKSPGEEE